jgi:hypothetical protein
VVVDRATVVVGFVVVLVVLGGVVEVVGSVPFDALAPPLQAAAATHTASEINEALGNEYNGAPPALVQRLDGTRPVQRDGGTHRIPHVPRGWGGSARTRGQRVGTPRPRACVPLGAVYTVNPYRQRGQFARVRMERSGSDACRHVRAAAACEQ